MFLHGGILHFGGNMLYLWIFGDNVEDGMGHGRFLTFYFLCGWAAALAQTASTPDSVLRQDCPLPVANLCMTCLRPALTDS